MKPLERWLDLAWVVVLGLAVWMGRSWVPLATTDPDRLYHFAVSRETAAQGLVRQLPQVTGLDWDKAFPDKEFLYHQLTGLGYRFARERGVETTASLIAWAFLAALYGACRRFCGPVLAGTLVLSMLVLNDRFLFRLELLRPHVLAMALAVCVIWAVLAKREKEALAAGALFALAYHAIYIPAGLFGLAAAMAVVTRNRPLLRTAGGGVAGIAAGVLLNPYFPANLVMAWSHVRIGLQALTPVGIGLELVPLRTDIFGRAFGPALLLVLGAALYAASRRTPARPLDELLFLGVSTAGFWGLAMVSPRAIEYAMPLSALFVAAALGGAPRWLGAGCVVNAAAGVAALLSAPPEFAALQDVPARIGASLRRLPAEAKGKLVFNCNFDSTPYLLYHRPDVRFLDILDPKLLRFHVPEAATAREHFNAGKVVDGRALVHDRFGADYVMCDEPLAVQAMDADPRFKRLYPTAPDHMGMASGPALYAVEDDFPHPATAEFGFIPVENPRELETLDPARFPNRQARAVTSYFDLRDTLGVPNRAPSTCALMHVAGEVLAPHVGATLLGVGGGPLLRLWVSGKPVYDSGLRPTVRLTQNLVPLSTPLQANDSLDLVSCASRDSAQWGLGLSLWTDARLAAVCGPPAKPSATAESFAYGAKGPTPCVAPFAVPTTK